MAVKGEVECNAEPSSKGADRASSQADLHQPRFERRFLVLVLMVWLPFVVALVALAYHEYTTGLRLSTLLFSDILVTYMDGNLTRLLGVMTTVSYSSLLVAGVCAGIISFSCNYLLERARGKVVWAAAAGLFLLAALDERFLFHEEVGNWLRVNDALLMAFYPAAFMGILVWGRSEFRRFRRNRWLLFVVAVALFISLSVDYVYIFDTEYAYLTLIEDGAKVFASLTLLLVTLKCLLDHLRSFHETGASQPLGVSDTPEPSV